jgi:surface protein
MSKMFAKCWVLKNINLSSFDTQKVNDMSEMFSNCYQLSKINLSPFIIKKTTNVENIFSECENLKKIIFNKKSFNNIKEKIDFGKTNINIVYA